MNAPSQADIAIIGCGAAGLFAAIFAARTAPPGTRVVALDGAKKLGAKILVAGGGRCNVTHYQVSEKDYATSGSHNTIRNILRRFTVEDTVAFFKERGVHLKREETGKLFPTTDNARTVLNALLDAARDAGVEILHPWRVAGVEKTDGGFVVQPEDEAHESIRAKRVILCTGGKALPKSGSDGIGYEFARALGHTTTPRIFPALVPLKADPDRTFVHDLSGIAAPVGVEVRASTGKRLAHFENAALCTHFGLSGPAILDISRFLLGARDADPDAQLVVNWLPMFNPDAFDTHLASLGTKQVVTTIREHLPERLAHAICRSARVEPSTRGSDLRKDDRRALATAACACEVPITASRGFTFAEVTAGGVLLDQINAKTMASRACEGLYLAGEILDVDGRIGGFNFQWAWASGFIAGQSAAGSLVK